MSKSQEHQREVRTFSVRKPLEVRTLTDGSKQVAGYAIVFNSRSADLGGFVETCSSTMLDRTLKENPDVLMLRDHKQELLLGRTTAGTLELTIDSTGLAFTVTLPKTQIGDDTAENVRLRNLSGCSFGFSAVEDSWTQDADGTVVRTLHDVDLFEISVCTFPAYSATSVSTRSCPVELRNQLRHRATRDKHDGEKRYRAVRAAVAEQKWAIMPSKLETIVALLEDRAAGKIASTEEIRQAVDMQHGDMPEVGSSIAVIPVYGTIAQRMGMFDDFSGGTSCESISKRLKAALADDSVTHIVLDVDSPGGTVTGVPELAAEIFAARDKKPITAVANGLAASAAYWIASAASKVVVIPSGEVGSIGVYTLHQDVSAALEDEGVKMTFVKAGKYKTDGNPFEPLGDDARADMQRSVDVLYNMFTRAVAEGRSVSLGTVLSGFGQGRCLMAEDALAAGMVDEIATLDEVLASIDPSFDGMSYRSVGAAKQARRNDPDQDEEDDDDFDRDDDDSDGDEDEERCDCECSACEAGDCDDCSDPNCDDAECVGCPQQDERRSDQLRVRMMFAAKHRNI